MPKTTIPRHVAHTEPTAYRTPADPTGVLAAAETEADEAAHLAAALEERVRDGDDTVTAAEVDEAHKLSRFARLRKEAAERKAARAKADMIATARREHAEEIKAAVTSGALDVAPVVAAYAKMRAAADAFVKAANTYNQAFTDTSNAIRGYPYRMEDSGPTMQDLGVRFLEDRHGHSQVLVDGTRRLKIRTSEQLGRAVLEAETGVTGFSPQYPTPLRRKLHAMDELARRQQPDLANGGEVTL